MLRLLSQLLAAILSLALGIPAYAYAVGNRTQKVSTLPGYPGGLSNYNANDQLSTDTYDNDGNTTVSNGVGYAYDFENHLVQAGAGISLVYDGDGNRVSKTVAGVTTQYLVDPQNPTGYAQVVYESFSGSTAPNREQSHTFSYGLELVNEARSYVVNGQSANSVIYFDYDGHGSVRALTDNSGTVTDTYDYDAFGNLIHATGTTYNNYLFAGEQFDPDLNLYYNRARYLNTSTGRFWSMDAFDGDDESPLSLHKYLYVGAEPVDERDPSGHGFEDTLTSVAIQTQLFVSAHPILTAVMTGVLLSLAPPEVSDSFMFMGPEVQLISEVETEAKELTTIRRLLQSSWLDKFQAGSKFESWMLNRILAATPPQQRQVVVKDGVALLNGARVNGSAVIDAILNGVIMEFKTSFGAAGKRQAQQFARFAENGTQMMEYVFLHKPSAGEVMTLQRWVQEVGPNVKLAVTYILE